MALIDDTLCKFQVAEVSHSPFGKTQFELPLHARYPDPGPRAPWWAGEQYRAVLEPGVLLREDLARACHKQVDQGRSAHPERLHWEVPSANTAAAPLVDAATIATLAVCSLCLLGTLFFGS